MTTPNTTALSATVQAVPPFLRAIAAASAATGFMTLKEAAPFLALVASLIEHIEHNADTLRQLTQQIDQMTETGTNPTPTQWDELASRADSAHALIQSTVPTLSAPK